MILCLVKMYYVLMNSGHELTMCGLVCVCVCVYRRQKREWDFLELELAVVISGHVGVGNPAQVFCKGSEHTRPRSALQPQPTSV